jgi:hypothetical protein
MQPAVNKRMIRSIVISIRLSASLVFRKGLGGRFNQSSLLVAWDERIGALVTDFVGSAEFKQRSLTGDPSQLARQV